jgi:hypothetical protein
MAARGFKIASEVTISKRSDGYLLCNDCNGYYHLKSGEKVEDFHSCECGGILEFFESFPPEKSSETSINKKKENELEIYDDYQEIEQLLTLLKRKSEKRNALIKDLSNRIHIQEGLLHEIKENRWNLWDILDQRNLQSDIKNQKRLLDDIADNEDRLMDLIKEQRHRAHISENNTISYVKKLGTSGLILIEFVVIVVLLFLLLA